MIDETKYQALLQYWEASKALRASDTDQAASAAVDLMNEADIALWVLKQPPEMLRRRVKIVDSATERKA